MAKKRALSIHSRAARRATSPGIDTDQSLKNVKPPAESVNYRPAVLAAHSAGISKKSRKGRKAVLSTKARKRLEKSVDRAEAVLERTAQKIERSKGHAKSINGRRKGWDDVNKQIPVTQKDKTSDSIAGGEDREAGPGVGGRRGDGRRR